MIDLANIPAPDFVEVLSFEALLSEIKVDLTTRDPSLSETLTLESEPLTKLIEAFAYRELLLRARVNDAAKATLIAYATGPDLDNLAALFAVERFQNETDTTLRNRVLKAFEGLSVAGPKAAYAAHARAADPRVKDVSVHSPSPGEVVIAVKPQASDDVEGLSQSVHDAVNADSIRPLTDSVNVVIATPISVDVTANLSIEPNAPSSDITYSAGLALEIYFESLSVGDGVAVSKLYTALDKSQVISVQLTGPAADIVINSDQYPVLGDVTLNTEVVGD